jgi:hypothetical protein
MGSGSCKKCLDTTESGSPKLAGTLRLMYPIQSLEFMISMVVTHCKSGGDP